ncbi:MAG: outer membrane protein assembly factor BamC [Aquincola tertiaricarbonis]|uniref:outer membrane protein assembly factor BamC n=1 Tax=Aquincola TaxID=391952 RepID=UPI0006150163|nr:MULTISPECIES: outer membrane protein assembly factor BamC [Aquincola]MCR5865209.1 outer membrane protein assembly factor BamC [Aquincola sp. J276]
MRQLNRSTSSLAVLALVATLAGCSSVENLMSGDKIDYRSKSRQSQTPLEVPPDLTQLARDGRYQAASGSVSAAGYQANANVPGAVAPEATQTVAPQAVGDIRVLRDGNQRWLFVPATPEQLWPQLQQFWQERGFVLTTDTPSAGVMETDWAENRAKIADDIIRRTLGRVLDSLYSTGERDKFRTRVERVAGGTEIYISHRGMEEVYTSRERDQTSWTGRPSDPQLEAEFLQRLMVKLGTDKARADQAIANAAPGTTTAATATPGAPAPSRARIVPGEAAATLQIDEGFDRAWRRVGLALDRGGFTVEDRDRAGGIYYVRYADPKMAGKEEPGFFSKLFSFGDDKGKNSLTGPGRYRINLKSAGERTTAAVYTSSGQPENGDIGQRIVRILAEDLK